MAEAHNQHSQIAYRMACIGVPSLAGAVADERQQQPHTTPILVSGQLMPSSKQIWVPNMLQRNVVL
jgi:hypothetical protein